MPGSFLTVKRQRFTAQNFGQRGCSWPETTESLSMWSCSTSRENLSRLKIHFWQNCLFKHNLNPFFIVRWKALIFSVTHQPISSLTFVNVRGANRDPRLRVDVGSTFIIFFLQAAKYGQAGLGSSANLVLTDEEKAMGQSLKQVWAEILKIEIKDDTDFFATGAGSMDVVRYLNTAVRLIVNLPVECDLYPTQCRQLSSLMMKLQMGYYVHIHSRFIKFVQLSIIFQLFLLQ